MYLYYPHLTQGVRIHVIINFVAKLIIFFKIITPLHSGVIATLLIFFATSTTSRNSISEEIPFNLLSKYQN